MQRWGRGHVGGAWEDVAEGERCDVSSKTAAGQEEAVEKQKR